MFIFFCYNIGYNVDFIYVINITYHISNNNNNDNNPDENDVRTRLILKIYSSKDFHVEG